MDHPEDRLHYHKAHFNYGLDALEAYTKDMLKEAATRQDAEMIRLVADSMVKCFNQLYCDVNQGFPGYGPAEWPCKSDKPSLVKTFMNKNREEFIKIRDNTTEYDWLVYMDNLLENEPYTDKDIFGVLGSLLLTYDNLPDDCVDEKTMTDYLIIELNHAIVEMYDI